MTNASLTYGPIWTSLASLDGTTGLLEAGTVDRTPNASWLADVLAGRLSLPFHADTPPLCYGYPPALIPLWSTDAPSYVGSWWHGPIDRAATFVRLSVEGGRRAREIARTVRQLALWIAWNGLEDHDGMAEPVVAFADAVGIESDELARLDAAQLAGDPLGPLAHPSFAAAPPREAWDEASRRAARGSGASVPAYDGDMPSASGNGFDPARHCALDLQPGALPEHGEAVGAELFDGALASGDIPRTWLALNAPGWNFADAKQAAARLRERSSDPALRLMLDAWCAQPHEDAGGMG